MTTDPKNIYDDYIANYDVYGHECFEYHDQDVRVTIAEPIEGIMFDERDEDSEDYDPLESPPPNPLHVNSPADISEVYYYENGSNDYADWVIVGKSASGLFFYLRAWCDCTGFDCRGGLTILYTKTWECMRVYGLDDKIREHLSASLTK